MTSLEAFLRMSSLEAFLRMSSLEGMTSVWFLRLFTDDIA